MDIIETIKLVGGVSAIVSATFLIADRILLFRPQVDWRRVNDQIGVVVKNVSSEAIFVENMKISPAGWALAWSGNLDHTVDEAARTIGFILEGQAEPISFVLERGDESVLHIVANSEINSSSDGFVEIKVTWRFCRNRWLPQLPAKLKDKLNVLSSLKQARA